jgi:hypothetical protein
MGSEFVQDPWWGNWATGLAKSINAAPGVALHNTAAVEGILKAREERAREQAKWDAAQKASEAGVAAVPEATVAPSMRDVSVENQGPVNPADPTTQPGEIFLPPTTVQESFIDPRALAAAKARAEAAKAGIRATLLNDPSKWAPQVTHGEVAAAGMPTDPRRRAEQQFQATGRWPTAEESKTPNAQNFVVVDAEGKSTGQGYASLNGGRTAVDGTQIRLRPGDRIMESGAAPLAQPNPIESAPIAQNNFNQLAEKILAKVAANQPISNAELNAARAMRDAGWQRKVRFSTDPETGREITQPHYDIVPPEAGAAGQLFRLLAAVDQERPATSGGAAAAAPAATTAPEVTGGGASTGAPVPPPLPVPLTGPKTMSGTGDPKPVVAEYMRQPVVHAYENAKTGYATFIGNLPFNNMTSDLAMIIGAAKILDPPSVVREGEVENVRKTGSVMDKFIGQLQSLKGEARLPVAVRMQLWNMVNATMEKHNANIKPIYEKHAVQLSDRQVDHKKYLPDILDLKPVDASYVSTQSGRVDASGKAPKGATAAPTTTSADKPVPTQDDIEKLRRKLGGQ